MSASPSNHPDYRQAAKDIFAAGLAAADPYEAVRRHCRREGDRLLIGDRSYNLQQFRHIYVIGAGKAGAKMGAALESVLENHISDGLLVVKYGYTAALSRLALIEAGHPVPDENGLQAAGKIMEIARQAGAEDLVITLISGGGSALLPLPAPGLSLSDKQETLNLLLACGATISEINLLRKHLSAIKGGRLAQAVHPATLVSLIISDVVGDDPGTIASGPTVADRGTRAECRDLLDKYDLAGKLPPAVRDHLSAPAPAPENAPTFRPGAVYNLICANNRQAIMAARAAAADRGYNTLVLSSLIEGETREVARVHAAIAKEVLCVGHPLAPPACILSGGETTVTIKGRGRGGRNQEFCLAAVEAIAGWATIVILSGGTDGTDGPTDAAGALVDHDSARVAAGLGLSPAAYLADNDSYAYFQQTGELLMTGPTNTNVMDLQIMLVL